MGTLHKICENTGFFLEAIFVFKDRIKDSGEYISFCFLVLVKIKALKQNKTNNI